MGMKRTIRKEIIKSLRKNPENWTFDRHYARHKQLPIEIWLCNRFYGTRWTYGAIQSDDDKINCGWWFKPWQWWRVEMIRAVEEAQFKTRTHDAVDSPRLRGHS